MYGQAAGITTATLWWAVIVGLVVSGVVIYSAVRLALMHDRAMVKTQAAEAEHNASRDAAKLEQDQVLE